MYFLDSGKVSLRAKILFKTSKNSILKWAIMHGSASLKQTNDLIYFQWPPATIVNVSTRYSLWTLLRGAEDWKSRCISQPAIWACPPPVTGVHISMFALHYTSLVQGGFVSFTAWWLHWLYPYCLLLPSLLPSNLFPWLNCSSVCIL